MNHVLTYSITIYRISNCSTDSTHPQIFSFISTDTNEIMECHAFLCSKRKLAETVTLAVAQAFNAVYEAWKRSPDSENLPQITTTESMKAIVNAQALPNSRVEEKLINFDSDEEDDFQCEFTPHQQTGLQWVINISFIISYCQFLLTMKYIIMPG